MKPKLLDLFCGAGGPATTFIRYWNSINKPPYDWDSNPWVFVYSFELTEARG